MIRHLGESPSDDRRPPLERLESLVMEPGEERARRMMSRIMSELERTADPGPWIAAARTLAANGLISDDTVCYFATMFLECVTMRACNEDDEMLRIFAEIAEVRRAHGLQEDEDWGVDEGPPEWLALDAAFERRDLEIRVSALRAVGQDDLADQMGRDLEGFRLREAAGERDLWGADEE